MLRQIMLSFLLGLTVLVAHAQQDPGPGKLKNNITTQSTAKKIDQYVQKQMEENHIPGLSLAIVQSGKVVLAKGYGLSNLELSVPASPKTAFAIYSITKTFTAISTMMLVEEGKIALDASITKYVDSLPASWTNISIRHLLTHTSGIPDICEAPANPCFTSKDFTQREIINMVAGSSLQFSPGDKWEYSNMGYFLLGMLIEKVSGRSYEQFIGERIFKPLKMEHTRLQNYGEVIPGRADGYTWEKGAYHNALRVSPTLTFSLAGLVSDVLDLAKYIAALDTEMLLKKTTLEEMWTKIKLNNGEIINHGLGFGMTPFRDHHRVGHSGGHTGFMTTITWFIDDNISVIILSNADGNGYKTENGFLISDIANEIASFYFKK